MKKIIFLCMCAYIAYSALYTRVEANLPVSTTPWEHIFECGTMIFYMTPRQIPPQDQMDFFRIPPISEERMQIRTGLYRKTEPREAIYYIHIDAFWRHTFFSNCGRYIATLMNTVDNFDGELLGGGLVNFFANGEMIKSYGADDLLRNPDRLRWTSAGYFWRHDGSGAFNRERYFIPQEYTLTVTTAENQTFTFDIRSGAIISDPTPLATWQVSVIRASKIVLLAGSGVYILLKK